MSTHSVQTRCKICKKDLDVQIDDDYFGPLEKILSIATCNTCFDLREKHLKATQNIENLCTWLVQHPTANHEKRKHTQERLEHWTKEYAQAIQQFNRYNKIIWSEEFAKNLMERPDKWYEQLKFYRKVAREQSALV